MSIAAHTSHALPLWRVLLLCLIPALIIALILLLVRIARARYGDQPADLTPDPQPQPQPQRHPRRLASHHSRTRMETETGPIAPLTGRAKGWVPVAPTDPRRFHADGGGQS
jgi:hypothetical protein